MAKKSHTDLEAFCAEQGREWARLLLEEHLELRADTERRVEVTGADSVVLSTDSKGISMRSAAYVAPGPYGRRHPCPGHGIGRALLRHVLAVAVEERDRVSCVGVVTDAKPEAVGFCQGLGFVAIEDVREGLLHGEPLPMVLTIDTLASALEG